MAFLRDIITTFGSRTIRVELDPLLLPQIDHEDKVSTIRTISFNLYKLIYRIGTIQSRRFAPSNRNKYFDKLDLAEKIIENTNEFRVKINEIRNINGSETLTSISEDFGVGISLMVAENLFNIKPATIERIYGNLQRPDWRSQTTNNRILVVECKGSSNQNTSNTQLNNALIQKRTIAGNIQVASATLIIENTISVNRFVDPPGDPPQNDPEMEYNILRAGHYASVFSFLGNSKLSRYFSSMRKRVSGEITPIEQNDKNRVFKELNNTDPIIQFQNRKYSGHFFNVVEGKYLFVGVDINLLSYNGFIDFNYYPEELETLIQRNKYILFNDGVILIEIENFEPFNHILDIQSIQNFQDKITISDIDEMNKISFMKFLLHILQKESFTVRKEIRLADQFVIDIVAEKNNTEYPIEVKLFKQKKINVESIQRLQNIFNIEKNIILLTNAIISDELRIGIPNNIQIIDRDKLRLIAQNKTTFEQTMTMPKNR